MPDPDSSPFFAVSGAGFYVNLTHVSPAHLSAVLTRHGIAHDAAAPHKAVVDHLLRTPVAERRVRAMELLHEDALRAAPS